MNRWASRTSAADTIKHHLSWELGSVHALGKPFLQAQTHTKGLEFSAGPLRPSPHRTPFLLCHKNTTFQTVLASFPFQHLPSG